MIDDVIALACAGGGYASRGRLVRSGLTDVDIKQAVRRGVLVRLRHGTYALRSVHDPLTPEGRHRLLARSVLSRLGEGYVLSHHSAAVFHTNTSFGIDLDLVHVTRLDGRKSRREAGVQFHAPSIDSADVVEVDGLVVVAPARAVMESACATGVEPALVTINSALHAGVVAPDELVEWADRARCWPGSRNARLAMRLADPGCESVGESRSMYLFFRENIPRPDTQVELFASDGRLVGRTDFDWPAHRHVGEFDGLFKYGRVSSGLAPGEVVVREKRREDGIRELGRGVSRWTWSDLGVDRRQVTAQRILRGLETSRRLYARNSTTIPLA